MIGTLTGKDADVAARIVIQQEFYSYRAKLHKALIEKLKNDFDPCPIKSEKYTMISDLEKEGVENPVTRVLSVLADWLTICVYYLGADKARKIVAHAIDDACAYAKRISFGEETQIMNDTKSLCVDEMWSLIKLIESQKEAALNNGSDSTQNSESAEEPTLEETTNISLRLRELIHSRCLDAAVDAATSFAEEDPAIDNPIIKTVASANCVIGDRTSKDYYGIRYSLHCRGEGVERLRKQMREKRDVTKFLQGVYDPFEDVAESSVFQHGARVYEQLVKIPRADIVHISILDESNQRVEPLQHSPSKSLQFKGFRSLVLERSQDCEENASNHWISGQIDEDQLKAFVLGLSEYLCDDFGLKTLYKDSTKDLYYPADGQLRLKWSGCVTVLEWIIGQDIYQKQLDQKMLHELKQISDFLLRNTKEFMALSPPLPRYVMEIPIIEARNRNTTNWLISIALTTAIGVYLCLFRRTETEHTVTQLLQQAQTKIVHTMNRKKR